MKVELSEQDVQNIIAMADISIRHFGEKQQREGIAKASENAAMTQSALELAARLKTQLDKEAKAKPEPVNREQRRAQAAKAKKDDQ